jgi:tRNA A37 N6-isopentenylltransferase MiaA
MPGKIIIVAGGTGLYPFSDLIDLLFKNSIANSDPQTQASIFGISPILK